MRRAPRIVALSLALAAGCAGTAAAPEGPPPREAASTAATPPDPPVASSDVPAVPDASSAVASASASAPPSASSSSPPRFACAPPDKGMGEYHPYAVFDRLKVAVPKVTEVPAHGFDLYLHFHFGDAVRRVVVGPGHPMVFAGLDLGEGSEAYKKVLSESGAFDRILAHVEEALREKYGPKAKVRHVVLSSWSAGFGASMRVLKHHPKRVRGVILLDSLYAPYAHDEHGEIQKGKVYRPALETPLAFARRAVKGERFLFLSTSNAETHGYASTGEVLAFLGGELGVTLQKDDDPAPLARIAHADEKGFHARKHRGSTAEAHCLHLSLAGEAMKLLRASGVLDAER